MTARSAAGAALTIATSADAPKQRGRPRSEECRRKILRAAMDVLAERGFRATTTEAIAERAGASKVTVYRWWSNKAAIVLDAFLQETSPSMPYVRSSSALADLRAQMQSFARVFRGPAGTILAGLAAEGILDAEVGQAFRDHWIVPRRADAFKLLRRAVDEGELSSTTDLEVVLDALFGPLYHRLLMRHQPLSKAFVEELWASVVYGIASKRSGARHRRR